jgi:CheY-like chemotaxis protein
MLLVDDEPSVCDAIKLILAEDGHEVLTAASGAEALLAYRVGQFDLLITDYEMPVMKGDKLAAAIKRLAPQQRVILITAYAESLRASGDFPLAVDAVISKPFDVQEFRNTVYRLTQGTSQLSR